MCTVLHYLYTLYHTLSIYLCIVWSAVYITTWALMAKSWYDWSMLHSLYKQLRLVRSGICIRNAIGDAVHVSTGDSLPVGGLCDIDVCMYVSAGMAILKLQRTS